MKNGAVLDERIFWMEMDDGEYDTGRPLTLDQLKREFGDNRNFPLDAFLADGGTEPTEGMYRDREFMIHEVKSAEELYGLMTWQGPRPDGGTVGFPKFRWKYFQNADQVGSSQLQNITLSRK